MGHKKSLEANVTTASPHTIKKFELIEEYVKAWAQILLNYSGCNGIVFIDCMCNSGIYQDGAGNEVVGTPIRVSDYLAKIMHNYPTKKAWLYFNDLSAEKIEVLKTRLPPNTSNFRVTTRSGDGNELLKKIKIPNNLRVNYLLIYDPFQATVDWEALLPFFHNWGEVIINHMVSDPIRGVSQAKKDSTVAKYEQTYLANIEELTTFGSNKNAYEKRLQEIIVSLRGLTDKKYFIASFPFFNMRNVLVYNLLHCSGNIKGFKLFKKIAWKTFGGKSSSKDTHGDENQLMLDLDGFGEIKTMTDEYCYYVKDIVEYLHDRFKGNSDVPITDVWQVLDEHPVFPSEGYRPEIRKGLKDTYGDTVTNQTISFR